MDVFAALLELLTLRNSALILWNVFSILFIIWCVSTVLRKLLGLHIIGLTGSIATGKSICSKFFEDATSFYVIDFDEIAHDVYAVGRPAWSKIKNEFGDDVLNKDWTINRKKLGAIVWKDRNKLNKLSSITRFPIFKDFLLDLFLNIFYTRTQILTIPLLIESKFIMYLFCDFIILIYCNKPQQITRLMDRDRITKQEALNKINKQINIEKKKIYVSSSKKKNIIIDNSSDLYSTQKQLQSFVQHYHKRTSWKMAMTPTKLSFILSSLICIVGYIVHKVVTFI
eukprot:117159_1